MARFRRYGLAAVAAVVLALVLSCLLGGCEGPDTPGGGIDPTLQQAIDILLRDVIKPATLDHNVIAFGGKSQLPAGTEIAPYAPDPLPAGTTLLPDLSDVTTLAKTQWFFWVDDMPRGRFDHPTRYVLIDVVTEEVTVLDKAWPPAINGDFPWSSDADYNDPDNQVFSRLNILPTAPAAAARVRPIQRSAVAAPRGNKDGMVVVNGWSAGQTGQADFNNDAANARDFARLNGIPDRTANPVPGGIAAMRAAIQALVNQGVNDVILYITCHGGRDASGTSYLSIHGQKVTAADLNSLMDEFPAVDFKILIDACHSGGLTAALIAGGAKIVITACLATESAYGDLDVKDDAGDDYDPNPEDVGGEFSSGFWHDMFRIKKDTALLQQAQQFAQAQGIPLMAAIMYFAFDSAVELDLGALAGVTHPGKRIRPGN